MPVKSVVLSEFHGESAGYKGKDVHFQSAVIDAMEESVNRHSIYNATDRFMHILQDEERVSLMYIEGNKVRYIDMTRQVAEELCEVIMTFNKSIQEFYAQKKES